MLRLRLWAQTLRQQKNPSLEELMGWARQRTLMLTHAYHLEHPAPLHVWPRVELVLLLRAPERMNHSTIQRHRFVQLNQAVARAFATAWAWALRRKQSA